jgi:hypothetical protein
MPSTTSATAPARQARLRTRPVRNAKGSAAKVASATRLVTSDAPLPLAATSRASRTAMTSVISAPVHSTGVIARRPPAEVARQRRTSTTTIEAMTPIPRSEPTRSMAWGGGLRVDDQERVVGVLSGPPGSRSRG